MTSFWIVPLASALVAGTVKYTRKGSVALQVKIVPSWLTVLSSCDASVDKRSRVVSGGGFAIVWIVGLDKGWTEGAGMYRHGEGLEIARAV